MVGQGELSVVEQGPPSGIAIVGRLARWGWRIACRYVSLYVRSVDPFRRRRVRRAAHRLVPKVAWASEEATGDEIARLALLRLLWLQREIYRAARHREHEATVLLTRTAIETAITGWWCLKAPDAAERFAGETKKRGKVIFKDLIDQAGLGFLDAAFEPLGTGSAPPLEKMIELIMNQGGGPALPSLHSSYYLAISSFYAHGGPLALSRHVRLNTSKTLARPYRVWSRRSAKNMVDALVGVLALQLSGADSLDREVFTEYANVHWPLAWKPWRFLAAGFMATKVRVRHLPAAVTQLRHLRAVSGSGGSFSAEEIDAVLDTFNEATGLDPSDPNLQSGREWLRNFLLGDSWRNPDPRPTTISRGNRVPAHRPWQPERLPPDT